MKKVLLNIIGSQSIDDEKDRLELTTIGSIEELENEYFICYNEEQEPPFSQVHVSVKISKDKKSVEMIRTGAFDSCLIIEKSKRNLCHYGTEYGDILMGISGHEIEADYADDNGKFRFSYDIDLNGALASRNEVIITYKNQE